eukprot:CAMPEP_0119171132 /NCGR_PEP_ID=MMETSP1315-20130426/23134_1 /TAXON_ID=676789 /ORGANISM="Prasinoderma singularis, Strain RCC927" /LENGTH=488 /DNA_ID=CAMNT_0007164943 /DNA_START=47 /DNA_END=1513 /DNA_ORIENTATION=-
MPAAAAGEARGVGGGRAEDDAELAVCEPSGLCCPVTAALFRDPVFVPESGTTYERSALLAFWATQAAAAEEAGCAEAARPRDPFTNRALRSTRVFVNWDKRREVAAFLQAHPGWLPPGWETREVPPPDDSGSSCCTKAVRRNHKRLRGGNDGGGVLGGLAHRRNRSFGAAEAAEWARDLVLGGEDDIDDADGLGLLLDDDERARRLARRESLSAHRAAAALLVVMAAALVGVLHPMETLHAPRGGEFGTVDDGGLVAPGGGGAYSVRGEVLALPPRCDLEVEHDVADASGTLALEVRSRDATPATGALVGLSAAWLVTVAAWTWSSLDGGAPLLFVAFAAPFWAAGACLATAATSDAAVAVSGVTVRLDVSLRRGEGGTARVLWEVAGVEVYERQVALGPRPEVHAVPGMVEVRASGASVADAVTFSTGRYEEHEQLVAIIGEFYETVQMQPPARTVAHARAPSPGGSSAALLRGWCPADDATMIMAY